METLMHTCCAPCSVSCIRQLRGEGIEPVSFWYNPNIHPYQEYKARRDTLMAYAPANGMKLIVREDYGLRDFCRGRVRRHRPPVQPLLPYPPVGNGTVCGGARLCQLHQHPVRQPLSEPRRRCGRRLRRQQRPTGGVPVPGFPSGFRAGQQEARERGLLHAEILRVRVQRGGPLPQAARPGSEESGKDHWITAAPPVTRRGCCWSFYR